MIKNIAEYKVFVNPARWYAGLMYDFLQPLLFQGWTQFLLHLCSFFNWFLQGTVKGTVKGIVKDTVKGTVKGTFKGTVKGIVKGYSQGYSQG